MLQQKGESGYHVSLETVKELFKCNSIGEANRKLIEFKNMKLVDCELDNQTMSIKFFGPLSERLGDLSKAAYAKLYDEAKLEADLLKYMYLMLRLGATPTQACCNPRQVNPNMQALFKQYSLAEEHAIKELFPQNAFKEFLEPLKGNNYVMQEAIACMQHLLTMNMKQGFLKKEVELLKGPGSEVAREYLNHALVRTLLGHPPKKQPSSKHANTERPLDKRPSAVNFAKIDPEYLLEFADKALTGFLLTRNFFDDRDRY